MEYKSRKLSKKILSSLKQNSVVLLNGPRQSGKTTLAQELARRDYPAEYVSFDNLAQIKDVYSVTKNFVSHRKGPLIIDEVQLIPSLFNALETAVHKTRFENKIRSYGMFLLTSSTSIAALPKLWSSLSGGHTNLEILYPFSSCEVFSGKGDFLERLFSADFADIKTELTLTEAIELATFPDISGKPAHDRKKWFDDYLTTIIQHDSRIVAELKQTLVLQELLMLLAARTGKLNDDATIAQDLGLSPFISKKYRHILESMFLSFEVRPWRQEVKNNTMKSSKEYIVDQLLFSHLLDCRLDGTQSKPIQLNLFDQIFESRLFHQWSDFYSRIVETFVANELQKMLFFCDTNADLFHFRIFKGKVDFVLEQSDGLTVGIEVKASKQVVSADFKGMKSLYDLAKDDLVCGIVLYLGEEVIPFGDRFFAVPFSILWQ